MRLRIPVVTLTVCLAFSAPAPGQSVDFSKTDSAQLIAMLGERNFFKRDRAHGELIRRGGNALADLKLGAEHNDLEIRSRCRSILEHFAALEVDPRLAAFLAGKDDASKSMPGWKIVSDIVGGDETGRRIYAILYKGDPALLQSLEDEPDALSREYRKRVQRLSGRGLRLAQENRNDTTASDPRTELTTLLVVASAEHEYYPRVAQQAILKVLQIPIVQFCYAKDSEMRRLVEKWLTRNADNLSRKSTAYQVASDFGCSDELREKFRIASLQMIYDAAAAPRDTVAFRVAVDEARFWNDGHLENSLKPAFAKFLSNVKNANLDVGTTFLILNTADDLGLKEGVDLAIHAAFNKEFFFTYRQRALAFAAKFGDESAIPKLEPLLDDTTPTDSCRINDRVVMQEIRDSTLVALIQLSGQHLADYPIDRIRTVPDRGQSLPEIAFEFNDTRLHVQHRWRESRSHIAPGLPGEAIAPSKDASLPR